MKTILTLKKGAEQKTFAEWGIRNVRRNLVSQDIDTVTFEQPHATALDDPLFAESDIIEIFRDDERLFYGRVEDAAPHRSGSSGGLLYTVSGPWWWLANMGFRQSWKIRPGGNPAAALVEQFTSYCLLGCKVDGTQQSIADQIAEAVNYAISQDAPLQVDMAGLPTLFPPIRDVWNAPVAEVIQKMIEWTPDIVCWFDYSTDPYPTLRMRRRADQEAVSIDLEEPLVSQWQIRPRNDLRTPGVVIYYIRSDSTNGAVYTVITEEKFPLATTGREPKALLAAINLEGANATYLDGFITCEAIQEDTAEFWKRHSPNLQSDTITDITIKPNEFEYTDEFGQPLSATRLPRELFGTWAPWMGGNVQTISIRALVSYKEKLEGDDGEEVIEVKERPHVATILTTDLTTGTYRSVPGGTSAEPQPIGLAEALYNAAGTLHFEGQALLKEDQCSGLVSMGNVVNFTGGRAEWETMRAQVQAISEEIDTGATTITFGPPKHLGPSDYIELLRATRNRIRFASPASRGTGLSGSSSAILPKTVSKHVATRGQGGVIKQVWKDPSNANAGKVTLSLSETKTNPANPTGDPIRILDGREVKLREITVCENNVERKMIVLCSEIYD